MKLILQIQYIMNKKAESVLQAKPFRHSFVTISFLAVLVLSEICPVEIFEPATFQINFNKTPHYFKQETWIVNPV